MPRFLGRHHRKPHFPTFGFSLDSLLSPGAALHLEGRLARQTTTRLQASIARGGVKTGGSVRRRYSIRRHRYKATPSERTPSLFRGITNDTSSKRGRCRVASGDILTEVSLPCPRKHVDANGRAFAGSRKWIQYFGKSVCSTQRREIGRASCRERV